MNCDILHIKSTAVTYTAATGDTPSSLVITLPNATLTNGQVFTLDICQQFPAITAGDNPQVSISLNSQTIPVYLKIGNYVRANGLRCRKHLVMVYGTDPIHISVLSPCLKY